MKAPNKKLNEHDLQTYLNRLVEGELTHAELENVASDLTKPRELYARLKILAKSFEPRYIKIFERFAVYPDDVDVAIVALRALINFHNKAEYLPLLIRYIDGVAWDNFDDLKLGGIHIATSYLSDNKDSQLIAAVIKQFESFNDEIIREAAHEALMKAAGIEMRDVKAKTSFRRMTERDLRLDAIEKLKKQIAKR